MLLLYTGGTIGMAVSSDGTLVPLRLDALADHLPVLRQMPVRLTIATFDDPIDSATADPEHWLAIAAVIGEHLDDHDGVVVLHGTDTLAYTASALSFLLPGLTKPVILTGAQRPLNQVRSDGRENIVTAMAVAAERDEARGPMVPEVAVHFDEVLLRGNRTTKVHAERYHAFDSPNLPPLAVAGVSIGYDRAAIRRPPPSSRLGPVGEVCRDVAALKLFPGMSQALLEAVLGTPGLKGLVVETFGTGNAPGGRWLLEPLAAAVAAGLVVVNVTQCHAGAVSPAAYATGAALADVGVVAGHDLTFEAAITKLMVLLAGHEPAEVARLMGRDLVGELTEPGGRARPDG